MPLLCYIRNCLPFDVENGEVDFACHLVGEPEVGFLDQAVGGDGDDFQHLGPADCGDEAGGPRLAGDGHAVEGFAELLFLGLGWVFGDCWWSVGSSKRFTCWCGVERGGLVMGCVGGLHKDTEKDM